MLCNRIIIPTLITMFAIVITKLVVIGKKALTPNKNSKDTEIRTKNKLIVTF
jgi:hypothetical protein